MRVRNTVIEEKPATVVAIEQELPIVDICPPCRTSQVAHAELRQLLIFGRKPKRQSNARFKRTACITEVMESTKS